MQNLKGKSETEIKKWLKSKDRIAQFESIELLGSRVPDIYKMNDFNIVNFKYAE